MVSGPVGRRSSRPPIDGIENTWPIQADLPGFGLGNFPPRSGSTFFLYVIAKFVLGEHPPGPDLLAQPALVGKLVNPRHAEARNPHCVLNAQSRAEFIRSC